MLGVDDAANIPAFLMFEDPSKVDKTLYRGVDKIGYFALSTAATDAAMQLALFLLHVVKSVIEQEISSGPPVQVVNLVYALEPTCAATGAIYFNEGATSAYIMAKIQAIVGHPSFVMSRTLHLPVEIFPHSDSVGRQFSAFPQIELMRSDFFQQQSYILVR